MKRKICVYVSEDVVSRLAVAAEYRGATKSGLVGAALDRFLDTADERDDQPGVDQRLAQMGRQLDHLARELRLVNETVAMHARYHLTVTPPLPDTAQPAACRLGAARFEEFAAQVGRRVEEGRPLIRETLERLGTTGATRPSPESQGPASAPAGYPAEATCEAMSSPSGAADQYPVEEAEIAQTAQQQPEDDALQPVKAGASNLALILRVFLPFAFGYYLSYLFRTISALTAEPLTAEFGLAGRANAALNVIHIGGAFVLQELIGIVIERWPVEGTHHPMIAYQVAFGIDLALQLVAWIWFMWPRVRPIAIPSGRRYSTQAMLSQVMAVEASRIRS
jgi:hypothetical protein